jgi:hypothetical protein
MAEAGKLDLKRELKHLYQPSSKDVVLVDVPELQFAMIDGRIEPGMLPGDSPEFASALGALYGISYTLKFMCKKRAVDPVDYTVMALEGLWTTPEGGTDYATSDQWQYTMMIVQPDFVTAEMFGDALTQLRAKREKEAGAGGAGAGDGAPGGDAAGGGLAMLDRLRLERFREGLSIQIMHVGPYADEPATLAKMDAFAKEHGYVLTGRHHEIYLGDPRTARPENLRTVLRHAVARMTA